ncbi:helix-turn-helix domain-containing protein [Cellulophaga sp. BC115SP]|uniref:helix-turn-helix domain-containing protein n=1 Tax=Cellulophaga sp. BC115SP TaxID=2683263 RepID=UPI00141333F8|nr:helix-turn-helix transcriptional regulator [Cellulophaga sp. BC115SP]NBB30669.1 helix-turn-helix domain-containing protein [Cellulophaga sp. BC115SP]
MKVSDFQVLEKVKKLLIADRRTFKELAEGIGMTEQGLSTSLKRGTLKLETLVQIADYLKVDVSFFLSSSSKNDEELYPASKQSVNNEDNKYLLDILARIEKQMIDKDEQIKRKDEQLSQLLNTNNALVMAQLGRTNFNLGIADTISSDNEEKVGKIILFTPLFEALVVTA